VVFPFIIDTRAPIAAILLVCLAQPAWSQQALSLERIFDPARRVDFDGSPPRGLEWVDDQHFLQPSNGTTSGPPLKVDAVSGLSQPLFDAEAMEAALAEMPGIGTTDARRLARQPLNLMNTERTATVFDFANDLYHYEFGTARVVRLTRTPEPEEEVSFSPNGQMVAFVRSHDLHIVDVDRRREHALTADGGDTIRNGLLNWVYQEEIYGRGNFRGYWWSPDSSRIAFLRLDDSMVSNFTIVDHIDYHPAVEEWAYPKAGDPNPTVQLGIVRSAGGNTTWVNLEPYTMAQPLVVDVGWTPDSRQVTLQLQDREQTWLDLHVADVESGRPTRLLRETTNAWVSPTGPPRWLGDGTFLWLSERSGWKHLYHYESDGTLIRQVTDGEWELRELHGVDESQGWIYWSGTERSHVGGDVYRVRLDGSSLTRLSTATRATSTRGAPCRPRPR
jgi:dipeptidyl-peptidase-4